MISSADLIGSDYRVHEGRGPLRGLNYIRFAHSYLMMVVKKLSLTETHDSWQRTFHILAEHWQI